MNIKADNIMTWNHVAGLRVEFRDANGNLAGSVTTGAQGTATLALPAVTSPGPGTWGAYYTMQLSNLPSQHYSVSTTPYGGDSYLVVPAYDDQSYAASFACTVTVSTW